MVKFVIVVLLIVQVSHLVHTKPFLLNSTASFITQLLGASSAAASGASSDANGFSENIAVIPRNSPGKLVDGSGDDDRFVFPDEVPTSTEAPSFVARKVNKILKKLVTISQITNALQGQYSQNNNEFQYPNFPDLDKQNEAEIETNAYEFVRAQPNVVQFARRLPSGSEAEPKFVVRSETQRKHLKGSVIESKLLNDSENERKEPVSFDFSLVNGNSEADKPLRFQLSTNITNENNLDEYKANKKIIPANIALFIIEIFTSLIGLTLGAVTQLNHSVSQNNTV